MTIRYKDVKPWGRSFDEYCRMFALTPYDLDRNILGCGDGPASFNAAMTRLGKPVVSVDPLYQLTADEIARRLDQGYEEVMQQTRDHQDRFVWSSIRSVEELGALRMAAMKEFLADYERGKAGGRYLCGALPRLPLADASLGLALCSHFLFLYTDHLSLQFHLDSILEMMRVAGEVRIFPLLDVNANRSSYLGDVLAYCANSGWSAELVTVEYEFQRGGKQMLQITRG
jgi:hypothetical protein